MPTPLRRFLAATSAILALTLTAAVAPPGSPRPGPTDGDPLTSQLVIGHRGASAYRPEHTFAAYDLAVRMDVDMLECDLQLTADEVLVCVHDTTVDRTSDGEGRVDAFTLAELRQLDFGSWFDPAFAGASIVPFEEQLDCYLRTNPRLRFHVETKGPATYGGRMEERLVSLLERKGLLETGDVDTSTIVVQSFDPDSLALVKDRAPSLPTALLWPSASSSPSEETAVANALVPLGLLPDYADVAAPNSAVLTADPTLVARFHLNGIPVHTWTVNDRETMDTLLAQGVDGLFTNNPDLLRAAVDERGRGTDPTVRGNPAQISNGCPDVAGRVTSPHGPGDVWEPSPSGRGVRLVVPVDPAPREG